MQVVLNVASYTDILATFFMIIVYMLFKENALLLMIALKKLVLNLKMHLKMLL